MHEVCHTHITLDANLSTMCLEHPRQSMQGIIKVLAQDMQYS